MRWAVLFLPFVASAIAQSPEPTPTPTPTPPVDPKIEFKVSIVGNKHEFHIGEIIPLKLAFSSRIKNRYYIDEATYDRSGRMYYEEFKVTPTDGTEDPLATYFESAIFISGGLTNFEFLTTKPWTIQLNLNEWKRFTKAGKYSVRVFSNRLEVVNPSSIDVRSQVTALANEIKFEILPRDYSWEKRAYDDAIAKLKAASDADFSDEKSPARRALEILRYLGTADAARELVNQLGRHDEGTFDCYVGLVASPEQTVAREALEKALADPDRPLTDGILDAVNWFEQTDHKYNRANSDDQERAFLQKLIRTLPNKRGEALRISLYNVLDRALMHDPSLLPSESIQKLVTQFLPTFDQLTVEQQQIFLGYRWDQIKSPALIPLLKHYAEADLSKLPRQDYVAALWRTSAALQRWYELDPAGARVAVIRQISDPHPRDTAILSLLPDKTLPEVDQALAEHFAQTEDEDASINLSRLIARYATGAILPQVLKKLDHHSLDWECNIQEYVLAYILRVDPVAAKPRIEQTIAARSKHHSGCTRAFSTISDLCYNSVLEEIGLRALDDANPKIAADAAEMLGKLGSPACEAPLLRRYENWNKRWNGHAAELNVASLRDVVGGKADDLALGESLFDALVAGRWWLTDPTKLNRLAALTKIPSISQSVDQYLKDWKETPPILSINSCTTPFAFRATLLQYKFESIHDLREKLIEFPAGTEFVLELPSDEKDRECVAEIRDFLMAHKMQVTEKKPGD